MVAPDILRDEETGEESPSREGRGDG